MQSLEYLRTFRNMPWITRGMKIVVDGKEGGHVAGGYAGNVAVKFPDRKHTVNCHPFWNAIYYAKDGNVIRNYYENQEWVADGRDHSEVWL